MDNSRREPPNLLGLAFDQSPSGRPLWPWMVVATLLALALRLIGHSHQSFWTDEVESVKLVMQPGADALYVMGRNFHGPLHKALVLAWATLFGTSDSAFRLLSVVIGTATVPALWAVVRRWAGERAALWAAFLLAVNPFHIWYSQEVRGYVLLMFLGVVSMGAFLLEVRSRNRKSALGYFASALAVSLANFGGLFILAAQGAVALLAGWRRGYPFRRFAIIQLLVVICLAPYLVSFGETVDPERIVGIGDVSERTKLRGSHTFSPLAPGHTFYAYSVGLTLGPAINDMHRSLSFDTFRPYVPVIAAAAIVFGALVVFGLGAARRRPELLGFLLLWLLVPILATAFLAIMNVKVYNIRYPSVGFCAWIVIIALGMNALRPRWVKLAAAVLVFGLSAASIGGMRTESRFWRPDAREAAHLVAERGRPDDRILLYTTPEPFIYYYDWVAGGELDVALMNAWHLRTPDRMEEFLGTVSDCPERLWLVRYRSWYIDPEETCKAWLDERLEHVESFEFDGVSVDLYRCRDGATGDAVGETR